MGQNHRAPDGSNSALKLQGTFCWVKSLVLLPEVVMTQMRASEGGSFKHKLANKLTNKLAKSSLTCFASALGRGEFKHGDFWMLSSVFSSSFSD